MKNQTQEHILEELIAAYWDEMETVQNYLASSVNLVGVRAQEIKEALADDVTEELGHAQKLAKRIHILHGTVPGSFEFSASQEGLQPGVEADVLGIIRGVIEAEAQAIARYRKLIEMTEGEDPVTQDLCINLLADEESHKRQFTGFLAEYETPQSVQRAAASTVGIS